MNNWHFWRWWLVRVVFRLRINGSANKTGVRINVHYVNCRGPRRRRKNGNMPAAPVVAREGVGGRRVRTRLYVYIYIFFFEKRNADNLSTRILPVNLGGNTHQRSIRTTFRFFLSFLPLILLYVFITSVFYFPPTTLFFRHRTRTNG